MVSKEKNPNYYSNKLPIVIKIVFKLNFICIYPIDIW